MDGYKLWWVQWEGWETWLCFQDLSPCRPPGFLLLSLHISTHTEVGEQCYTRGALSCWLCRVSASSKHSHGAPPAVDGRWWRHVCVCSQKGSQRHWVLLLPYSLPYRAAFRPLWMVTGASGPIVPSQLSGISGDQWVRLCRSCFSGSLPFRNSFAPRESSNSCLGWLGDSFVLPELGKAAPAGPSIWLLACNLLI